jgi:NAD(P)-dependent dehydrogenase (short-subunit alcohol dehydrogenase family)
VQAHVCAAKAGVDMLVKTLALEWSRAGVRVNAVWPGAVDETEGIARLAPTDADKQRLMEKLPMGSLATADDIAETVLFICSESARYMTGSIVVCDGGMSLVGMNALLPGF